MLQLASLATGFAAAVIEKDAYLLAILEGFNRHPYLRGKLALKGGTALNLFLFNVPRLSVDIDLNYIGAVDRDTMIAERPKVEQAIGSVCQREGLSVQKIPSEHAGGSWNLRYKSVFGPTDALKIDVVYMYRIPLWPPQWMDSHPISTFQATGILVLDQYELAAGKLAALIARRTSRDLFDAHALLTKLRLDRERLRLGFVLYGAMNILDWRKVSAEDIEPAAADLESYLLPLLGTQNVLTESALLAERLLKECIEALAIVLPLVPNELEFLEQLLEYGEIKPELITSDEQMQDTITHHPSLLWKALNVRKYKGL